VTRALSTSVYGNSLAFGFSITITGTYGALSRLHGSPSLLEIVLWGVASAVAVAVLEVIVTRGFWRQAGEAPSQVQMFGTALAFLAVAAGIGAAIAVGELFDGVVVWPAGGAAAATIYVVGESAEVFFAERIQRRRGDPQAGEEEPE